MSHPRFRLLACALLPAAPAFAAPNYTASATGATPVPSSPVPVSIAGSAQLNGGTQSGGAFAAASVGADASSNIPGTGFNTGLFVPANASASATHDDVVISGPAGPVPFTLHLPFHATLSQHFVTMTYPVGNIDSAVTQGIGLEGETSFGQDAVINVNLHDEDNTAVVGIGTTAASIVPTGTPGPFSSDTTESGITVTKNFPISSSGGFLTRTLRVSTPAFSTAFGGGAGFVFDDTTELQGEMLLTGTAFANVPFTLSLIMNVSNTASPGFDEGSAGDLDARSTFGIPENSSAVFDLPPGYTANSPSLNLVNNATPEPSLLLPLAAALPLVPRARRRRR